MQLFPFFPASFSGILPPHRRNLFFVYALLVLENVLNLALGYVMGYTINEMAKGNYWALCAIAGQLLAFLITGTLRRYADTRVYSAIYADFANHTVSGQFRRNMDVSVTNARVQLSKEFVDFLEKDMAVLVAMCFSVAGSAMMLLTYARGLFAACILVLCTCVFILRRYSRSIGASNTAFNNLQEQQVNVLSVGHSTAVNRLFSLMRRHQIRISDAGARAFLVMEIFLFSFIVYAIMLATKQMQAGDIFGMLNYVLTFVTGIYNLPVLAERLARLSDIRNRLS